MNKKLSEKDWETLRLVKRSQHSSFDGWAPVSLACWGLMHTLSPDLIDLRQLPERHGSKLAGYVRLTPEGEILIKWV